MQGMSLKDVPVGMSIRFLRDGKEVYLRKIRKTAVFWSEWYDPIRNECVREDTISKYWERLD